MMLLNDSQYLQVVDRIKNEIAKSQYKATLAVNSELIMLYYHIGKVINENKSWDNKFIDHLAKDIKLAYPNSTGYFVRNLKYMSKFAETYPDAEFVQQVVAQIPWGHTVALIDQLELAQPMELCKSPYFASIRLFLTTAPYKSPWNQRILRLYGHKHPKKCRQKQFKTS